MGYDLYGVNPTVNSEYPPRYNEILKKYGKNGWLDWSKDIPEEVKNEYFNLQNEYQTNNPGSYFRNNVWYWRPLWDFVCHHCSGFLTPRDCSKGGHNGGERISKTKSVKIAKKLSRLIADGTVAHYEKEHRLSYEIAKVHNDEVDEELDELRKKVKKETGKKLAPANYPKKYKEEWDKIYAKRNWHSSYPFTAGNVEEFAKFCMQSGGFEIC